MSSSDKTGSGGTAAAVSDTLRDKLINSLLVGIRARNPGAAVKVKIAPTRRPRNR